MIALQLALVTLVTAGSQSAPEHEYRVHFPEATPRGVVVFLHGVSLDPFDEEGAGIEALAAAATERGFVAVIPIGYRVCDYEKPKEYQRCWLLDQIASEVTDVRKIIAVVERTAGVTFQRRHIIGFSNGGFLVAGALQRGLLDDFTRIGILSAGPMGDAVPPPPKHSHVFIEVGKDDRWQRSSTRQLVGMLTSAKVYETAVHFREVEGGHVFDGGRASNFLRWFWDGAG